MCAAEDHISTAYNLTVDLAAEKLCWPGSYAHCVAPRSGSVLLLECLVLQTCTVVPGYFMSVLHLHLQSPLGLCIGGHVCECLVVCYAS